MAQVDEFTARGMPGRRSSTDGHRAVDSLLPYMHARDVAYMVTTARGRPGWVRGAGAALSGAYEQNALPNNDQPTDPGRSPIHHQPGP